MRSRPFRRLRLAAVSTAAAAALALSACSAPADSSSGGTADSHLTLGLLGGTSSFAARDLEWGNIAPYVQAVYDTLLRLDTDAKVTPGLATKWSYNADKTVLTLTLRDGVNFTDGTPVNAKAVVQNLLRFRDGTSSVRSTLASIRDAAAIGDTTVRITLKSPDPGLLTALAQAAGAIEAPSAFGGAKEKTVPVGSGPYVLDVDKTVPGSTYQFSANPHYWDAKNRHYSSLTYSVLTDPTAMLNAVKGHQVDFAVLIDTGSVDQMKTAGYKILSIQSSWLGMLYFDRDGKVNPALADVRVRQAMNYAFDRESLLKAIGHGNGTATTQIFPTTSAAYDPALDKKYPYDPAKAKKLLAQAGYPKGFSLKLPSAPGTAPATTALVAQQLKDVGITATFTDAGNFFSDILAQKYAASLFSLGEDPDWSLINFQIAPNSTFNPFHNTDPVVARLITQIHNATDVATSDAAAKKLNKYLVDQAWFGPWYRPNSSFAVNAKTTAKLQPGNAMPNLWNITPKS
jgi:peptide/nickel transport system substrate-binding protein